ncbi:MAG: glycosyltransferase family protein [Magnetococcales bacterium]|nr:glycosyltransferase family protein [Magnetococcales bacterium]
MNRSTRRREAKLAKRTAVVRMDGPSVVELLNQARAHRHEGQWEEAFAVYRAILRRFPDHSEAWHDLGLAFSTQGRVTEAIPCFSRAGQLAPHQTEPLLHLGRSWQLLGRIDEAMGCFQEIVRLDPGHFEAWFHLGNLLLLGGRLEEAVSGYRQALEIQKDSLEARVNLGSACLKLGLWDEAVAHLGTAWKLAPHEPVIGTNLGTALHQMGNSDEAFAVWRAVLTKHRDFPDALLNLGLAAQERDRFEEGQNALLRVLEVRPGCAEAMTGLGIMAHRRGEFTQALEWFDAALKHSPDLALAHYNKSLTLLLTGDLARGWRKYEWRWRTEGFPRPGFSAPPWNGGSAVGKTILLHCEQGFGDSIQFVRFAPQVVSRGGRVLLLCPPRLHRLFKTASGIDTLVSRSEGPLECDAHIPLMSLPGRMDIACATLSGVIPYLSAAADDVARFEEPLQKISGLKVGVAWRGHPKHVNDRNRSIDPELLRELFAIEGCSFITLQQELTSREQELVSANDRIYPLGLGLEDFAVTAGLLSQLDLIISVDTAVAHLAGAMGRKCWLLLPKVPDWRWLLDRSDSPWYPTLKLFRQTETTTWEPVLRQITSELNTLLAFGVGLPRP